MKKHGTYFLYACLVIVLVLNYSCARAPVTVEPEKQVQPVPPTHAATPAPAAQYAAEVLSYMMQVTLGKAGNPKLRAEWRQRGLNLPLDFQAISDLMLGPNKRPSRVMVLDNNILGLSQVLYHYDQGLNLFKGRNGQNSLFPSKELLSVRVMLAQKLSRDEKISMAALMQRKSQILDPRVPAENIVLEGTRLTLSEMRLLKDVIRSDPSFMNYLEHPFIVETLYRIGAVSMDPYVFEKMQQAQYADYQYGRTAGDDWDKTVTVSILPSFANTFAYGDIDTDMYPSGLMPDDTYIETIEILKKTMLQFLQKLVRAQMFGDSSATDAAEENRQNERVNAMIDEHVGIFNMTKRPLVVYPENAEKVLQHICPSADINVIVLGKNVYLSLRISEVDTFPHANRVYLDAIDIKHEQVDYEISQISMYVFKKLKNHIPSISIQ